MKVRCPNCCQLSPGNGNLFHPFCSERCKLIDLGKWLGEDYRISGEAEIEISDAENKNEAAGNVEPKKSENRRMGKN